MCSCTLQDKYIIFIYSLFSNDKELESVWFSGGEEVEIWKILGEGTVIRIYFMKKVFSIKMKENTGGNILDEERSKSSQYTMVINLKAYTK